MPKRGKDKKRRNSAGLKKLRSAPIRSRRPSDLFGGPPDVSQTYRQAVGQALGRGALSHLQYTAFITAMQNRGLLGHLGPNTTHQAFQDIKKAYSSQFRKNLRHIEPAAVVSVIPPLVGTTVGRANREVARKNFLYQSPPGETPVKRRMRHFLSATSLGGASTLPVVGAGVMAGKILPRSLAILFSKSPGTAMRLEKGIGRAIGAATAVGAVKAFSRGAAVGRWMAQMYDPYIPRRNPRTGEYLDPYMVYREGGSRGQKRKKAKATR